MKDIYLVQAGESCGPFDDGDIKEGVASGEFKPRDLAWRPGLTAWVPLHSLEKNRTTLTTTFATEPPAIPSWPIREKNKLFNLTIGLCGLLFVLAMTPYWSCSKNSNNGNSQVAGVVPIAINASTDPVSQTPSSPGKGERLEPVFFKQDSAVLDDLGREVLNRTVTLLQGDNYREFQSITLIGFASSEGEIGQNDGLSMARAESVKAHLLEQGIPKNKVVVVPLGQANKGAEADPNPKMNRRVEISVVR